MESNFFVCDVSHDDTHTYRDSIPLRHKISTEVLPPRCDDELIHPHFSKIVIVRLWRPKKHGVKDQCKCAGFRNLLIHRFVSFETSARLTTEIEELGPTFRMNEPRAELQEMKTY